MASKRAKRSRFSGSFSWSAANSGGNVGAQKSSKRLIWPVRKPRPKRDVGQRGNSQNSRVVAQEKNFFSPHLQEIAAPERILRFARGRIDALVRAPNGVAMPRTIDVASLCPLSAAPPSRHVSSLGDTGGSTRGLVLGIQVNSSTPRRFKLAPSQDRAHSRGGR